MYIGLLPSCHQHRWPWHPLRQLSQSYFVFSSFLPCCKFYCYFNYIVFQQKKRIDYFRFAYSSSLITFNRCTLPIALPAPQHTPSHKPCGQKSSTFTRLFCTEEAPSALPNVPKTAPIIPAIIAFIHILRIALGRSSAVISTENILNFRIVK